MSTAHRPTFHNAIAKDDRASRGVPTTKVSSRDLPGHRSLKERVSGQSTLEDLKTKDFKSALAAKEDAHFRSKRRAEFLASGGGSGVPSIEAPPPLLALEDQDEVNPFPEDADDEGPKHLNRKRIRPGAETEGYNEDDDDDDDEDDEEAELLRELENIKRERAEEEAQRREAAEKEQAEAEREQIMRYNPLVHQNIDTTTGGGGALKISWEDDVVFKNQAKLTATQKSDLKKKKFVNDPVRSEFHKRFLQKYIV